MFKKLNINPGLVGIDINNNDVRLVKLIKTKTHYRLTAFANCCAATPAAALTKAIEQAQTKIKEATVAISYAAAMIKTISLDASLQGHEILRYLNHKIEKYTGVPAQNINMDFNVLGQTKGQTNKIDVELVATKHAQIEAKTSLLQQANIKAKAIDVESFALARIAALQTTDDVIAIINFTKQAFLLCILKHKKPIYTKEENVTSAQNIQHELQLFYAAHNEVIKRIILAGNIPNQIDFAKIIFTQTNIPTCIINPFSGMVCDSNINQDELYKIAPSMALSCGLALWQPNHD